MDQEEVQLPTRDEPFQEGHALPVNSEAFIAWLHHAANERHCGDCGYPMGARLLTLMGDSEDTDAMDPWNAIRAMSADILDMSWLRGAVTIQQEVIALLLQENDLMELGIHRSTDAKAMLLQIQSVPADE